MLSAIAIRHFQSLDNIELELSPLTVIVGQSSSGKSAFTRAVRTLTSNQRGHAFISHGEKIATIKATTDKGTVVLQRGKTTNDNQYTVIPNDDAEKQRTWTKLGGDVPEEVSAFIGIAPKDPINYAGQFDRPYLLGDDTSAGEVARVLGALTNVSIIFDAARESNRKKLAASATMKTRTADLATIETKVETYKPLKAQLAAIKAAEEALADAATLRQQHATLARAIETWEIAQRALDQLEEQVALPEITDAEIGAAQAELQAFQGVLRGLKEASQEYRVAVAQVTEADEQSEALEAEYLQLLKDAGTCPTCGQGTKELEHAHA